MPTPPDRLNVLLIGGPLDNNGAGFSTGGTVNFTYRAANDAKTRLDAALAARTSPAYTHSAAFDTAYNAAANYLSLANASGASESTKGKYGALALDQLAIANDLMLKEYGIAYAKANTPVANRWSAYTIDEANATGTKFQTPVNTIQSMTTATPATETGWVRFVMDPTVAVSTYANEITYAHAHGLKVLVEEGKVVGSAGHACECSDSDGKGQKRCRFVRSSAVGTGRGATAGVLIRNAEALESLAKVNVVVVDKTGTLTEGKPRLMTVAPAPGFAEAEVLGLAAGLEQSSEHPLAASIVSGAHDRGIVPPKAQDFRSVTGKGVTGTVEGRSLTVGTVSFLDDLSVGTKDLLEQAEPLRQQGQTVMFVAIDGKPAGLLGVADPIKSSTPEAIDLLHREGLRLVMLTGDSRTTAEAVARRLGIDEVQAEVLPEQKTAVITQLQAEGHVVAMAGDGINDAPALAQANVGIAMGTGTDVAMESAGVTLVKGDLRAIARARRLSRGTMRNIRQNLFFAFVYNTLGVPIAAGVLYPFFGILLSPMLASAAMTFSSVSVIGNALRLRNLKL